MATTATAESPAAQRVPAWKRMGLKLKDPAVGATESGSGSSGVGPVGHPSSKSTTTTTTTTIATPSRSSHKRKLDPPASDAGSPISAGILHNNNNNNKRPRKESSSTTPKKVTFGEAPSESATKKAKPQPHSKLVATTPKKATQQDTPQSKTSTKTKTTPVKPTKERTQPPPDIKPALEYLRQWNTARESWKFNKNHQSTLIKFAFEPYIIPAHEIEIFYEYIRDLKGFVRTRLRETAMEIQMRDEADGYAAFPEDDAMDLDEQQTTYESILADILRRRQSGKRKYFAESQFIAESVDGNVIVRRVVKRMRAEMVMDELSDGESTDATSSTASSRTVTATNNPGNVNNVNVTAEDIKRANVNDVSGKRRRKLRVNMEDSSSSESESDSDSDSDSSSTSSEGSDSDEDEEMRPNDGYDTSSSSSSSSSSGDSDSDEESDDED